MRGILRQWECDCVNVYLVDLSLLGLFRATVKQTTQINLDQLPFASEAETKCWISVYPKQIQLVARVELELGITRVQRPDHNITVVQSWSAEPIENNFPSTEHGKTWPAPTMKCLLSIGHILNLSGRLSGTLYCTSTSCLVMSCESVWPLCWTMAAMISVARSRSPPNIKELSIFWVVSWDSSRMRGLGSAPTAKFFD